MKQRRPDDERKRLLLKRLEGSELPPHSKDLLREFVEAALEPSDNIEMPNF